MNNREVYFTSADLFWEAFLRFCKSGNALLVLEIYQRGIEYNLAQQSKDSNRLAKAYTNLPEDLRDFKHNFLSRGKAHWSWLPWEN
jgi:hypothetical protein